MRLITLFSAGSHIPAATLNLLQRRAAGLTRASASPSDGPGVLGADIVHYQTPDAGLATGTVATVDASTGYDWRERMVLAWTRFAAAAANRWGRASEHAGNDPSASDHRTAMNPTGPGATGAAAATVANGTPPTVGTDSCPIPIDVRAGGTLWLFADPTSGALKLYNDTGTTLHFDLIAFATGREVNPSEPPPDLVPTMTEVLWLTPTVAASRPADPGAAIALHRATDTGAVTLWDGGAWRTIGLTSPLTTRGDLWVRGASGDTRLALGAALRILGSDGTDTVYRELDGFLPRVDTDTTDDTWTTLATWTSTETTAILSVAFTVLARKDDWSEGGVWRGACAHRRYGGTYTAMGPVNWEPAWSENAALEVRVQEGAGGVQLQVKGIAATDYRWRVTFTRSSLEE